MCHQPTTTAGTRRISSENVTASEAETVGAPSRIVMLFGQVRED